MTLHLGIARRSPREWLLPPESLRPPGTMLWQDQAAQTPFTLSEGLDELRLEFSESEREAPLGIPFVLRQGEGARWLKDRGGNIIFPSRRP